MKQIDKIRNHILTTENGPLPPANNTHVLAWVAILDFCESRGMKTKRNLTPLESVLLFVNSKCKKLEEK